MNSWLICLMAFLIPLTASTQDEGILNRLLAPGPLIKGHQDLEGSDCLKCHEAGKGIAEGKCMACHKEIKAQVLAQKGFHGLNTETCIQCHKDHKGRDYDSTLVDKKAFNHDKTGYRLEGKHAEIACEKCHTAKRTGKATRPHDIDFLGAQPRCNSCHKKDDPHHFTGKLASEDCIKCHGLKSWKENLKFDHDKDTRFKLGGKHSELKCDKCHKDGKYVWSDLKKSQCMSCHADFHKKNLSGKFAGGKCDTCHGEQSWKIEKFDHKVTQYPLRGKHSELQCAECHKQGSKTLAKELKNYKFAGLRSDCLSCHKDYHKFANYKSKKLGSLHQCLACHNERAWDDIHGFNHSVTTRFPIEGKHIELDCAKCHTEEQKGSKRKLAVGKYHWDELKNKNCETCHKSPHVNDPSPMFKKKRCDQCHVADGWNIFNQGGKKFDHGKTRFMLTGRHAEISCSACHVVGKKQVFKFEHVDQKFCMDCHKNPHGEQFAPKFSSRSCTECHNTSHFSDVLNFDHSQTSFPLKGRHDKVKCSDCHKPTEDIFTDTKDLHHKGRFLFPDLAEKDCNECHTDFHRGQLGTKCSTCHKETGWKDTGFNHNRMSRFHLEGKHMGVDCSKCHKPEPGGNVSFGGKSYNLVHYKPISSECTTCHTDAHKGHFGNRCQECHLDKGWKLTKDFHRNFSLSGVHYTLQCQECHRDNRRLAGMSQECVLCHQKDDIHQGTLPECSKCHKQQFWEDVDFKHSLTQFPLRGMHRTIECAQCHSRGIYQGTPTQCSICHQSDLQTAITGLVPHNPPSNFSNCNQCHNQFGW